MVFWITFGYAIVTSLIYILWSSDVRQEFDYEEGEEIPGKSTATWDFLKNV